MSSSPPSEEVLQAYYSGIGSFGKLCGTTDPSFQHDVPYQPAMDGTFAVGKRLARVGSHPIQAYFSFVAPPRNRDLPARIIRAIIECGLRNVFKVFNVLRIGDAPRDSELPPKILINVEAGQVSWADGMALAQRCRSEVRRFGIHDVHCEVYE